MPAPPHGFQAGSADTTSANSLWLATEQRSPPAKLTGEVAVDVAVIGGGIAGVTTALRLQRSGVRVALLEARDVASGVTGCTSAKVTALQSTMLSTIAAHHGADVAAAYAAASAQAVQDVGKFVEDEQIDCELQRRPAVTYAAGDDEMKSVAEEFESAAAAGLPVEWNDADAGLPYPVAGAVWLHDQIGLQPVRYVRGLVDAFVRDGGQVFGSSRVLSVESGRPCRIRTADGTLSADQVVVATHVPILDRGLFFARIEVLRSYCVAVRVTDAPPRAMAISAGSDSRSIQFARDVVIVGGQGHPAGAAGITQDRFATLHGFAAEHWDVAEPLGRWSAQDPVPYDHLPMIGPLTPGSRKLWVATGWAKWGLTGGTFAARILADSILGREHEWAARFTPSRLSLRSTRKVAQLGAKFSAHMAIDRVTPAEVASAEEIPVGEARVLRDGLGKSGAYRDDGGQLHAVSLRCTHLGCLLRFNGAERSWDCPCHGSRFDIDGAVLEGPAVRPLTRRPL